MSAVLGWVWVVRELDLSSPLDSSHNAEVHSVAIAAVKLCDHNEQLCFLPLSSFPQPQQKSPLNFENAFLVSKPLHFFAESSEIL